MTPRPPSTALEAWNALAKPWQVCFDQAWLSWCEGNLGIGAALVDPKTGEIVSVGRNRVNEGPECAAPVGEQAPIAHTFLAHAEMNAFATLPRFKADGLHLYTTLQPCLMCEATAVIMHTEHVHYAAPDALFSADKNWWDQHPYAARHHPELSGPMDSPLATFARVVPMSLYAATQPDKKFMLAAKADHPQLAALALELAQDKTLHTLHRSGATTQETIADLWPRLLGVT